VHRISDIGFWITAIVNPLFSCHLRMSPLYLDSISSLMKTANLPFSIEFYSDQQFIAAVKEFEAFDSDEQRVKYIADYFDAYEGLLSPIEREINGVTYRFGFDISKRSLAHRIGNLLVSILKEEWLEAKKAEVNLRLNQCQDAFEIKDIIEEELKEIEGRVLKGETPDHDDFKIEKYYAHGFLFEKSKKTFTFLDDSVLVGDEYCEKKEIIRLGKQVMIKDEISADVFYQTAEGAGDMLYTKYLKQVLRDISEERVSNVIAVSDANSIELEKQRDLVLYFKYTGLLDSLSSRIGNNHTAIAKVISVISGKSFKSIRPILSNIEYNSGAKSKVIYTAKRVDKVIRLLNAHGFDTTELDEIYRKIEKQ